MPSQHAQISENTCTLGDHEMFYLAAGPENGPLVIFAHGWPELGYSWRHQLPVLGGLGFRAIAPDGTDNLTFQREQNQAILGAYATA